jgi:hypothetical protein
LSRFVLASSLWRARAFLTERFNVPSQLQPAPGRIFSQSSGHSLSGFLEQVRETSA